MKNTKTTSMATLADYKKEFEIFQTNVNAATRAFYYHVGINQSAKDRPEVFEAVNESARFWVDYRYFTLQSVYIILGRIFDKDNRSHKSHGMEKLLAKAKSSGYFSKENLRNRKISDSSNAHEWIDQYMVNVHEFSDDDWKTLENFIESIRTEWDERVGQIRHKIFAHENEFPNDNLKEELINKCERENVENVLKKLMIVESILEDVGLNGKAPNYDHAPQRTKNLAEEEVNKMLNLLVASNLKVSNSTGLKNRKVP